MRAVLVMLMLLLLPAMALAQNQPPVADAGEDQTVFLGEFVQLDGTGSNDPDGDQILAWIWDFDVRPPGSGAGLTGRFSPTSGFTPDLLGDYVLTLVVADAELPSEADLVTVTVIENQPPVAVSVVDPTTGPIALTVNFDATTSLDPEGGELSYRWPFGDGGSLPSVAAIATHTYTVPGTWQAVLTVTDDFGLVDSVGLFITVTEPAPVPSPEGDS
jgi:PKD repeat protein